jgi:hypothetical protein
MSSAYIRICLRPFKPNSSHTLDLLDGILKKSGDEASHISAYWELEMYQTKWLNNN